MPHYWFKIGDQQREKKLWNSNQRAIYHATPVIHTKCRVIRHCGVSPCSDGTCPLWWSHPTWIDYFCPDDGFQTDFHIANILLANVHSIQPPSDPSPPSPPSLDFIAASKCISTLAWFHPLSVSCSSQSCTLYVQYYFPQNIPCVSYLSVYLISASASCISVTGSLQECLTGCGE